VDGSQKQEKIKMENKAPSKRTRIITILLVLSVIMNVALFFYALINNIAMKKEQEILIGLKVEVEKCISVSLQMREQLNTSLEETRRAKDFALEQSMLAAKEASKNK
jgi:hypothetical protein